MTIKIITFMIILTLCLIYFNIQEAFAEKGGLHRTYISAIECCRRSISLENIQRIADALKIETYKLFLEDENQ